MGQGTGKSLVEMTSCFGVPFWGVGMKNFFRVVEIRVGGKAQNSCATQCCLKKILGKVTGKILVLVTSHFGFKTIYRTWEN
jgi:hypothetical protein